MVKWIWYVIRKRLPKRKGIRLENIMLSSAPFNNNVSNRSTIELMVRGYNGGIERIIAGNQGIWAATDPYVARFRAKYDINRIRYKSEIDSIVGLTLGQKIAFAIGITLFLWRNL